MAVAAVSAILFPSLGPLRLVCTINELVGTLTRAFIVLLEALVCLQGLISGIGLNERCQPQLTAAISIEMDGHGHPVRLQTRGGARNSQLLIHSTSGKN